jgi:hypothetical protein
MSEEFKDKIVHIIDSFNDSIKAQLPAIKSELDDLIKSKTKDANKIELHLNYLESIVELGIGNDIFIKLYNYLKSIHPENAEGYWNDYLIRRDELN